MDRFEQARLYLHGSFVATILEIGKIVLGVSILAKIKWLKLVMRVVSSSVVLACIRTFWADEIISEISILHYMQILCRSTWGSNRHWCRSLLVHACLASIFNLLLCREQLIPLPCFVWNLVKAVKGGSILLLCLFVRVHSLLCCRFLLLQSLVQFQ